MECSALKTDTYVACGRRGDTNEIHTVFERSLSGIHIERISMRSFVGAFLEHKHRPTVGHQLAWYQTCTSGTHHIVTALCLHVCKLLGEIILLYLRFLTCVLQVQHSLQVTQHVGNIRVPGVTANSENICPFPHKDEVNTSTYFQYKSQLHFS